MRTRDSGSSATGVAAIALMLALGPIGCGDDEAGDDDPDRPDADTSQPDAPESLCEVTPGAWSATGFETNAAEALALRGLIAALQNDLLNTAEQTAWGDTPTTPPTLEDITDAYEAGSPSIKDVTPTALDAVMQQTFTNWVAAMAVDPAGYRFIDVDGLNWVATGAGALHERPPQGKTRRFRAYNAGGLEQRQIIDKGLFVGALYNYALGLTEDTITPATIHAIAAAWGANPTLDATPDKGQPANDDSAAYARSMGLYDETATALIAAQAYAADDNCTAERDAALVQVFRIWEEAMFARATFYATAPMRATLDTTVPETVMDPLHAASEGYGLLLGLRGLPHPSSGPLAGAGRVSTDADIDEALEALGLNLDDLNTGTTGEWVVEALTTYSGGFSGDYKTVMQDLFGWSEALFTEYSTSPVPTE